VTSELSREAPIVASRSIGRERIDGVPAMITAYTNLIERPTDRVERSCSSKSAFGSRRAARSHVSHGRHQDGTLRAYRCAFCGAWHLGHRPRRRP
jgi:hypothetical protein